MKILKKGGVVEKRGEEETKSIPHAPVYSAGQTVPSTDQSRAEGNNTECVAKKRFNGRVLPTGFGKSMCYVPPPLFGQGTTSYFLFLWLSVIHYCC